MSVVHRCDGCGTEASVPTLGEIMLDWCVVYRTDLAQPGSRTTDLFCSDECMTDYFVAKRMIEGAM
jgi:hypothetical protein